MRQKKSVQKSKQKNYNFLSVKKIQSSKKNKKLSVLYLDPTEGIDPSIASVESITEIIDFFTSIFTRIVVILYHINHIT